MRLRHITFATQEFRTSAKLASLSAIQIGAYSTHIYTPEQVDSLNIVEDSETKTAIDYKSRGAGYWLWKPAIIQHTLSKMPNSEYLVYTDASIRLTRQFRKVLQKPFDTKINVWSLTQPKNTIQEWTDQEVLRALSVPLESYWSPMVVAGVILVCNNVQNRRKIEEWFNLCKNLDLLAPDRNVEYRPNPELIWHRHDQSLLSILTIQTPEFFLINELSPTTLKYWNIPFVIDRNQTSQILLFFVHFEIIKRILRRVLSKLPMFLRKKIKHTRTNKQISAKELESHDKFY